MTKEEAHHVIENKLRCKQTWNTNRCNADCQTCPYFCDYDTTIKAYGMAIKALEQEPTLDKIRAEIENDWQLKEYPSSPFSCGLRRAIEIINKYEAESEEE